MNHDLIQLNDGAVAEKVMGFWTETSTFKLDDKQQSWIQIMPMGKYEHPLFGELDFNPESLKRFADNFHAKVRDTDLDVDYDHKEFGGKAAGWYVNVEVREDGLWALIEWTDEAARALKNREYRYFSPEFTEVWTHPKSGHTFNDVLFGGAITNRPFLKDILPINLSEVVTNGNQGGHLMDPKALRKALGLPEDASQEDVDKAVNALPEGVREIVLAPLNPDPSNEPEPKQTPPAPTPTATNDDEGANAPDPELVALSEKNPAIARMLREREEDRKRLAALETSNRLAEVNLAINELSEGKQFMLPPASAVKLKDVVVGLPKASGDSVLKLLSDVLAGGLVPLHEKGSTSPGTLTGDESKRFSDLVDAKIKASGDTLSYIDAVDAVILEEPTLYDAYRRLAATKEG